MKFYILFTVACLISLLFLSIGHAGGAVTPNVTQSNLSTTVCLTGYTTSVRPPSSYTQAWEKAHGGGIDTVVDHITPLCAGGDPFNYANYQLQFKPDSYRKDTTERLVCKMLCNGKLTLDEAQGMFW